MSQVRIKAHPETGKLFTQTNNPDIFKCRIESTQIEVVNEFVVKQSRSAFPPVTREVVESLQHLKDGDVFPIPGKIVRTLSTVPQYEGHQEVINPKTEEKMGYYQTYKFTSDMNASDKDLSQLSQDEQIEALGIEAETVSEGTVMQPNSDFEKSK